MHRPDLTVVDQRERVLVAWIALLACGASGCGEDVVLPVINIDASVTPPDLAGETRDLAVNADLVGDGGTGGNPPAFRFASAWYLGGPTGETRSIGVADFDGDGLLDVASGGDYALAVTLARQGGGWQVALDTLLGGAVASPHAAAFGDFDGDGRVDAVATDPGSGSVTLLLGMGDGTFSAGRAFPVGKSPTAVLAVDLDRNGKLDIVTANGGDDSVSVLLGRGDGTFAAAASYAAGKSPTDLTAGDFNGDGIPDIVTVQLVDTTVLLGKGDGTLSLMGIRLFNLQGQGRAVAMADFDRDGESDIVTAEVGGLTVRAIDWTNLITVPDGLATWVVTGDWNRDNKPDFAIAVQDRLGGDRQREAVRQRRRRLVPAAGLLPNRPRPVGSTMADFNRDGSQDIAVCNHNDQTVSVLLTRPGGSVFSPAITVGPFDNPRGLASGDIDSDGRVDLVVAVKGGVALLPGRGDGTFGPAQLLPSVQSPWLVLVEDVDGDGWLDMITWGGPGPAMAIYFNRG